MKMIQANPIRVLAVPLLLAVVLTSGLSGCQSGGKEKAGANQAAQGPAGRGGTAGAPPGSPATTGGSTGATAQPPGGTSALSQIPEGTFDINPALLGSSYDDSTLAIRFSPPAGWPPIEPDLLAKTREAYDKLTAAQQPQNPQFVSKPVRMFCNKDQRYYFILSDFTHWPTPVDPITKMDEYRQGVAAQNPDAVIQYGISRHGNLVLYQLLTRNQVIANLRVIVIRAGRAPIQVDYLVPQQLYPQVAKTIEASVGSIQPL